MSDQMVFFPPTDLESSVAGAIKTALMDLDAFHIDAPGFSVIVDAEASILFPFVGVDFRTVAAIGCDSSPTPEVFTDKGMTAKLYFGMDDRGKTVEIQDYQRFSTYMVGNIDDLGFDLFTWVGDAVGSSKIQRDVPLLIPVITDTLLVRQSARGEYVHVHGYLCVYGGASQGGLAKVKSETAKLYLTIKDNANLFTEQGMTRMLIEPPKFNTYTKDSVLFEGTVPFSCVVRIN